MFEVVFYNLPSYYGVFLYDFFGSTRRNYIEELLIYPRFFFAIFHNNCSISEFSMLSNDYGGFFFKHFCYMIIN